MFFTLLAATGLVLLAVVVRRIWFHPLSSCPGPWIARFTDFLDLYAIVKGSRTFRHHDMLLRYGSPVRAGTNHLIFSDLQSWTDIYGPSSNPCLKDPTVYEGFSVLGNPNLLSTTDRAIHGRLRRLLSHSFSLRGLADSEPLIAEKVQQYVDRTVAGNRGKEVDMLSRTYELYLDIVSWLSFGRSFDCLKGQNLTARRDISHYFSVVPLVAFVPIARYVPLRGIQEGLAGLNRLIEFASVNVDAFLEKSNYRSSSSSSGNIVDKTDSSSQEGTLLNNLAKAVDPDTGSKLTREDLIEHSILFLAAGSGTTSATLTFLLWECGRNEKIRGQLVQEIREAFPDPEVMPNYERASQLVSIQ